MNEQFEQWKKYIAALDDAETALVACILAGLLEWMECPNSKQYAPRHIRVAHVMGHVTLALSDWANKEQLNKN